MKIKLNLWVSNMDEAGVDFDATQNYIEATDWKSPEGVTLDGQTLEGEAVAVYEAFLSLAQAVAEVGHGIDDEDVSRPVLTACPEQLICDGYTCAAESLARIESTTQPTWEAFVASVPSLAEELAAN